MNTTIALRRTSTPTAPMVNRAGAQHEVVGRRHRRSPPSRSRAGRRRRRPRRPAGPSTDMTRLVGDRAVRQQRRRADRVARRQHAGPGSGCGRPERMRARGRSPSALGFCPSRSMWASTIAPTAATISSADVSSKANRYLVNSSVGDRSTFEPPRGSACVQVRRRAPVNARRPSSATSSAKPRPNSAAASRWPAQGLDERVRGVAADEHQHEQEQDHDRAGVDDDLHQAEERPLLDEVERAERHHRGDQRERRVDRVAQQHHADRAGQRERPEHPERHRLAERHLPVAQLARGQQSATRSSRDTAPD